MIWHITPFAVVLMITAAFSTVVSRLVWRQRPAPGAVYLALAMAAVSLWSFCYSLEFSTPDIPAKIIISKVEYIGINATVPLFFLFALRFTGSDRWMNRRYQVLIWLIPVITVLLAATNEYHYLIWTSFIPQPGSNNFVLFEHGAWWWVFTIYLYGILLIGTFLLISAAIRLRHVYRVQAITLLAGVPLPLLVNIGYVFKINSPGLDLTPIAFSLSGIILLIGLYRQKLFDLMPVSRATLFDDLPEGIIILDHGRRIVEINPAASKLLETNLHAFIGQPCEKPFASWPELISFSHIKITGPTQMAICTGDKKYLEVNQYPIALEKQHPLDGRLITLQDISARIKTEEALRRSEELFRNLFITNPLPLIIVARKSDRKILHANQAALDFMGIKESQISGFSFFSLYADQKEIALLIKDVETAGRFTGKVLKMLLPGGDIKWAVTNVFAFDYQNEPCFLFGWADITQQKESEAEMEKLATTDSLTGLLTRRQFFASALTAYERCRRYNRKMSVIMLDIDHFKQVNDAYGHHTGDKVLQETARICGRCLRKVDLIGRYGGEEFVLALPETGLESGYEAAVRLCKAIREAPIDTGSEVIHITISLGVAEIDPGFINFEDLLKCADKALYAAKQEGRDRVKVYKPSE